jgi:hypothetical protein
MVACEDCITQHELALMDGNCPVETHNDMWFPTELAFDYCHALMKLHDQPNDGVDMGAVQELQKTILADSARNAVLESANSNSGSSIAVANEFVNAAIRSDSDSSNTAEALDPASGVDASSLLYSSATQDAYTEALGAISALVPTPLGTAMPIVPEAASEVVEAEAVEAVEAAGAWASWASWAASWASSLVEGAAAAAAAAALAQRRAAAGAASSSLSVVAVPSSEESSIVAIGGGRPGISPESSPPEISPPEISRPEISPRKAVP